jgi:O-antigen/teichoic acid export membrane protein
MAALVAILLPPVLVRHMEPATYAVWVLVLQFVAYVGYLDFGLQTAVGRYVAFANEKNDTQWRDGIFSTAFVGLSIAALSGVVVIVAASAASHLIFPSIPISLLAPMRSTMLIVGISVALGLPASAWNGVFVGLQRFDIPAITVGGGKLLAALGLILAAIAGKSLVLMGLVVAGANLLSYVTQFFMLHRIAPEVRFRVDLITRSMVRELSGYCLSLTVWSFSMLLVTGFDLILVGRFQFSAVTPYSISATLITFLAGVQAAIFGVIMPHAAGLHARQSSEALGALLIKTTKLGVLLLLLTGLPLIVFAAPIIRIWIGPQFAQIGGRVLIILVIANMVRLTGVPYSSILIGTGQQRLVIVSPLMEGFTNLIASLLLGLKYGAIGVAWGTLVGAVVGMLAHVLYNLPRTKKCISVDRYHFIRDGLFSPAICCIPTIMALLLAYFGNIHAQQAVQPTLLFSSLVCAILVVRIVAKQLGSTSGSVNSKLFENI